MGLLFESYILDILVTLATLAYVIYAFFSRAYSYWKDRGVPYKKPTFIYGNMKEQFWGKKPLAHIYTDIYNEAPDSKVVGFYNFKCPNLLIRDPKLIEELLIKEFASFHDRNISPDIESDPLSGHLFSVGGKYWRNLRYKLTPTFTTGKLKSMFEQIYNCTDNIMTYIDNQAKPKAVLEAKNLFQIFSTNVIASCAFGLDFGSDSEQGKQFRETMNETFKPSKFELLRFTFIAMYPNLANWLKIKSMPKEKSDYFLNLSKETVRYRKEHNIKRGDFLQLILNLKDQEESGKKMYTQTEEYTEDDVAIDQLQNASQYGNTEDRTKIFTEGCIAAQSFVFLLAGSDSVSTAGCFCMYTIAGHPHVQKRLQREVDAVLEKHKGNWNYDTIKDMKYLDQVFNETTRMYPPVVFLFRQCNEPFKIPDTKHLIEPGTRILIPVYTLHHDEKYYPNPDVFDPERFAEGKNVPKGAYLPFGDGPRICIAMRFAQLEVKTCIARIVSQFSMHVNKKTQEPITFKPKSFGLDVVGGLWLDFERRVKA